MRTNTHTHARTHTHKHTHTHTQHGLTHAEAVQGTVEVAVLPVCLVKDDQLSPIVVGLELRGDQGLSKLRIVQLLALHRWDAACVEIAKLVCTVIELASLCYLLVLQQLTLFTGRQRELSFIGKDIFLDISPHKTI